MNQEDGMDGVKQEENGDSELEIEKERERESVCVCVFRHSRLLMLTKTCMLSSCLIDLAYLVIDIPFLCMCATNYR